MASPNPVAEVEAEDKVARFVARGRRCAGLSRARGPARLNRLRRILAQQPEAATRLPRPEQGSHGDRGQHGCRGRALLFLLQQLPLDLAVPLVARPVLEELQGLTVIFLSTARRPPPQPEELSPDRSSIRKRTSGRGVCGPSIRRCRETAPALALRRYQR